MIKLKSLMAMTIFFGLACCFIANAMSPSARAINAEIRKIEKKKISEANKADLIRAFISDQLKKIKASKGKTKDQVKDAILAEVEGANAAAIQEIKDAIKGLKSTPPAPPDPAIAAREELKKAITQAQAELLKIASDITNPLKKADGPLKVAGIDKAAGYKGALAALHAALEDKSKVSGYALLLAHKVTKGLPETRKVKLTDLDAWIKGLNEADANVAKAAVKQLVVNGQGDIEAAANKVAAEAYKAAVKKLKESAEVKRDGCDGRVTTAKAKAGDPKYTADAGHEAAWDNAFLAVNQAITALPVLTPASSKDDCKAAFDDARALTIKNGVLDKLEDACSDIEGDVKAVGGGHKPQHPAVTKIEIKYQFAVDENLTAYEAEDTVEVNLAGTDTVDIAATKLGALFSSLFTKLNTDKPAIITAGVGVDKEAVKGYVDEIVATGGNFNTGLNAVKVTSIKITGPAIAGVDVSAVIAKLKADKLNIIK